VVPDVLNAKQSDLLESAVFVGSVRSAVFSRSPDSKVGQATEAVLHDRFIESLRPPHELARTVLVAGGTKLEVSLRHGFGRCAFWDWRSSSSASSQ
jgi:hypothetical protein